MLFRSFFDLFSIFFFYFCLSILCLFYIFAFLCFVVLCFVIDPFIQLAILSFETKQSFLQKRNGLRLGLITGVFKMFIFEIHLWVKKCGLMF